MGGPASQTVVMKFGGTSVADADRIRNAAQRIVRAKEEGNRVVAVLSARGKTTDELISLAYEVSEHPHPREMDMMLSTGERISCALAAMVINDLGHEAESLTGSQAGIVTDASHTKARILDVRTERIERLVDAGRIVLVAGFQGTSASLRSDGGEYEIHGNVTTLGRGGSDTTAVAIAAALGADVCEIYTDVSGVYSADPRLVPGARKLRVVSFEEMLEMSASGARVLQLRSVEYARNHGVRIHCRSSFLDEPGTFVVTEQETMGQVSLVGAGMKSHPGVAAKAFTVIGEAGINIEMISTSPIKISCVISQADVEKAVVQLAAAFELDSGAVKREDVQGDHRPVVS